MSDSSAPLLSADQQKALLEENIELREENKELRRLLFASKRERFVPAVDEAQLSLGLAGEPTEPAIAVKQTISNERAVKQAANKAIRGGFPSHLPRVDVILEPEVEYQECAKSAKRSLRNWI